MGREDEAEENESKPPVREFYTVSQLATLLQLNEMTVYRMVKTGELPYHQIGRMMRFRNDDIEQFLKQHRVPSRKRPTAR
jgi:excisionase family DNA binding protein